jgi:hypothetical protein
VMDTADSSDVLPLAALGSSQKCFSHLSREDTS